MKKAVILLSGGLDSTTCLALARKQNYECYTLSFNYGQKHSVELVAAQRISHYYHSIQHKVIRLDAENFRKSALTDNLLDIPTYKENLSIPITYVPARNTIFLSIALGWAETLEARTIFIGVSSIDYSNYPDCRPEYIKAFQAMANLATQSGVEGNPTKIETPLINLSKAEIIKLGHSLGVDYSLTVSCYKATENNAACGQCDSCTFRKKGFEEADIKDPTLYL